jgi:hypothetical protein
MRLFARREKVTTKFAKKLQKKKKIFHKNLSKLNK